LFFAVLRSGWHFLAPIAFLVYSLMSAPFGAIDVRIQEWALSDWANALTNPLAFRCDYAEAVAIPGGQATLSVGYEGPQTEDAAASCDQMTPSRFSATAVIGETVLVLYAANAANAQSVRLNPFNTRAGMVALLQALQARQP
jgi:TRAP-type uncharacterized transport system fused permease subunit